VTGATGGIGKELVSILYQHNAKIYVTARSSGKSAEIIDEITQAHPGSRGELVFLKLQLDDLTTIKASAEEFLAKETRLDVLWNNAGVMVPPQGSKTVQGHELQIGINNLGHFLFTHFLTSVLTETAGRHLSNRFEWFGCPQAPRIARLIQPLISLIWIIIARKAYGRSTVEAKQGMSFTRPSFLGEQLARALSVWSVTLSQRPLHPNITDPGS